MKRLSFVIWHLTFSLALLTLLACKGKKTQDTEIIKTDYVAPKPTAPKTSSVDAVTDEVEWIEGRHYLVTIRGRADNTLPMVQDENGQKYIDNSVTIDVKRADSTTFFNHTYTTGAFAHWLSRDYQEKAILTGINLLGPDGNVMKFVVSLNYPESSDDESLDLLLQVDNMGNEDVSPFVYNDRDDLDMMEQE